MSKRRTLTIAMHIEDGEEMPEFVKDLFDRIQEYPEARDRVKVFAASWTNMFEEMAELEEKLAEYE